MFYDDWQGLVRVVVVGSCAYGALVVLLRVSGKRTLAKLNAFDFVVTVALGSTLATVLLSSSVALVEGVTALALLAGLQYLVAWASARSRRVERMTSDELRQAARARGHADLEEVAAIVLENDGTLSILTDPPPGLAEAAPRADSATPGPHWR